MTQGRVAALLLSSLAGLAHGEPQATPPAGPSLYESVCRACHDRQNVMVSAPKAGDAAAWSQRMAKGLDRLVDSAVAGIGAMPPSGGCATCSPADIREVILYMATPTPTKRRTGSDR
jgi:cytochrome c5